MEYYMRQAVADDYDEINRIMRDAHNIDYD